MEWWQWVMLGALVLGAETIIDTEFYLVFVGISAIAVGLNSFAPFQPPPWGQWLLFSGLSVVSILVFRERLYDKLRGDPPEVPEGVRGECAQVVGAIAPRGAGRARLRGATWVARNESDAPLASGALADVIRTEGVTLILGPLGGDLHEAEATQAERRMQW